VRVASIVGARPQFIKAAAVSKALRRRHREVLIHTGQHYDESLSDAHFRSLRIPTPDVHLGVGSGPHGKQTGRMLSRLERTLEKDRVDFVFVYGDTNSTLAGAITSAKMQLPLAHVEAGLRSFNRAMPEEINRVVADHLSTLLFAPTATAVANLAREGIATGVHNVGDVMYDVARLTEPQARKRPIRKRLRLSPRAYLLATVHRAATTDDRDELRSVLGAFSRTGEPVVFPVHPRTRKMIRRFDLDSEVGPNVRLLEPLDYLDFQALLVDARVVLTDSGGVQKEAYWAGVPCVTLRRETEWVETVADGWNLVVGTNVDRILEAVRAERPSRARGNAFGDGHAAEKIVAILDTLSPARAAPEKPDEDSPSEK